MYYDVITVIKFFWREIFWHIEESCCTLPYQLHLGCPIQTSRCYVSAPTNNEPVTCALKELWTAIIHGHHLECLVAGTGSTTKYWCLYNIGGNLWFLFCKTWFAISQLAVDPEPQILPGTSQGLLQKRVCAHLGRTRLVDMYLFTKNFILLSYMQVYCYFVFILLLWISWYVDRQCLTETTLFSLCYP